MIGKILSHLLGSAGEDFETAEDANHELMEFEEGGWVIVDVQGEKRTGRREHQHRASSTPVYVKTDPLDMGVLFSIQRASR